MNREMATEEMNLERECIFIKEEVIDEDADIPEHSTESFRDAFQPCFKCGDHNPLAMEQEEASQYVCASCSILQTDPVEHLTCFKCKQVLTSNECLTCSLQSHSEAQLNCDKVNSINIENVENECVMVDLNSLICKHGVPETFNVKNEEHDRYVDSNSDVNLNLPVVEEEIDVKEEVLDFDNELNLQTIEFVSNSSKISETITNVELTSEENVTCKTEMNIEDCNMKVEVDDSKNYMKCTLENDENHFKKLLNKIEARIKTLVSKGPGNKNLKSLCCIYCNVCKMDFVVHEFFKSHIECKLDVNHIDKCVVCSRVIPTFTRHQLMHHLAGRDCFTFLKKCVHCDLYFLSLYNHQCHLRYTHPEEFFVLDKLQVVGNQQCYHSLVKNVQLIYNTILSSLLPGLETVVHCKQCQRSYPFEIYINDHIWKCICSECYGCSFCQSHKKTQKLQERWGELIEHLSSVNTVVQCEDCLKYFLTEYNLKLHLNFLHHKKNITTNYEKVPIAFAENEVKNLQDEVTKTEAIEPIKNACKNFTSNCVQCIQSRLENIEKQVQGKHKMFIHCGDCCKDISVVSYIDSHVKKQLNSKHISCTLCGKNLSNKTHEQYVWHLRFHFFDICPYISTCKLCGHSFFSVHNLIKHLRNIHRDVDNSHDVITTVSVAETSDYIKNYESKIREIALYWEQIIYFFPKLTLAVHCKLCSKDIDFDDYIMKHYFHCTKENIFICSLCMFVSHVNIAFLHHFIFDHIISTLACVYQCRNCNYVFINMTNYKLHNQKNHDFYYISRTTNLPIDISVPILKTKICNMNVKGVTSVPSSCKSLAAKVTQKVKNEYEKCIENIENSLEEKNDHVEYDNSVPQFVLESDDDLERFEKHQQSHQLKSEALPSGQHLIAKPLTQFKNNTMSYKTKLKTKTTNLNSSTPYTVPHNYTQIKCKDNQELIAMPTSTTSSLVFSNNVLSSTVQMPIPQGFSNSPTATTLADCTVANSGAMYSLKVPPGHVLVNSNSINSPNVYINNTSFSTMNSTADNNIVYHTPAPLQNTFGIIQSTDSTTNNAQIVNPSLPSSTPIFGHIIPSENVPLQYIMNPGPTSYVLLTSPIVQPYLTEQNPSLTITASTVQNCSASTTTTCTTWPLECTSSTTCSQLRVQTTRSTFNQPYDQPPSMTCTASSEQISNTTCNQPTDPDSMETSNAQSSPKNTCDVTMLLNPTEKTFRNIQMRSAKILHSYIRNLENQLKAQEYLVFCVSCKCDVQYDMYFKKHMVSCFHRNQSKLQCAFCSVRNHCSQKSLLNHLQDIEKHLLEPNISITRACLCSSLFLSQYNAYMHKVLRCNQRTPFEICYVKEEGFM